MAINDLQIGDVVLTGLCYGYTDVKNNEVCELPLMVAEVKDIPAGMAAVRKQRTLGSGQHALPDVGLEQCGGGGTDV